MSGSLNRRRQLIVGGAAMLLAACGRNRQDRIEAVAYWQDQDFAFGSGAAWFIAEDSSAIVGFFQQPLASARRAEIEARRSIVSVMAEGDQPFIALALHFRQAGRADFRNLARYSIRFGKLGGVEPEIDVQHDDWHAEGSIELAGEAVAGQRLLGRVRRRGTIAQDRGRSDYRIDLGFDLALG